MKSFLVAAAFLATISVTASQGQTRCSIQEINLTAKHTCAARCTANVDVCGGGSCEVLENGGTGIRRCVCEEGFVGVANDALCVPRCVPGCKAAGGSCDAPGVCNCADRASYFSNGQCLPKPECNGDCFGKICQGATCQCAAGFFTASADGTCVAVCENKCDESKGLECVSPNVCACKDKTFNLNAFGICSRVTFASTLAPTTVAVTTVAGNTPTVITPGPTTPVVTVPGATQAPSCDVCARLAAIEDSNRQILEILNRP